MLLFNKALRQNLGFWIRQLRIERRVFIDALPGFRTSVNEHRACEDELLNGEVLKMSQQPLSSAHGDVFV